MSGAAIEVEVWEVPAEAFGSFVDGIPAPLGIGTVTLEDGSQVEGFLCEAHAVRSARATFPASGSWRKFVKGGEKHEHANEARPQRPSTPAMAATAASSSSTSS